MTVMTKVIEAVMAENLAAAWSPVDKPLRQRGRHMQGPVRLTPENPFMKAAGKPSLFFTLWKKK
jgi:hypothetical protein